MNSRLFFIIIIENTKKFQLNHKFLFKKYINKLNLSSKIFGFALIINRKIRVRHIYIYIYIYIFYFIQNHTFCYLHNIFFHVFSLFAFWVKFLESASCFISHNIPQACFASWQILWFNLWLARCGIWYRGFQLV